MQHFKLINALVLTSALVTLAGCAAGDAWRRWQDDIGHGWLEDEGLVAVRPEMERAFQDKPLERAQAITNGKFIKSRRNTDILTNTWLIQTADCNLSFDVKVNGEVNFISRIPGELSCLGPHSVSMSRSLNALIDSQNRSLPVGSCQSVLNDIERYYEHGGDALTIDEIKAYQAEYKTSHKAEVAKELRWRAENLEGVELSAEDRALIAGTAGTIQSAQQQAAQKLYGSDGKPHFCLVTNPAISGTVEGLAGDRKVNFRPDGATQTQILDVGELTFCK
ncbi:MAG: hypothetical protein IJ228_01205 [Succinivibrio sp.]|nr:hypothetical protein [Succinivibrio sp.]